MLLLQDKPYRCDNPTCPTGAVATPMEKLVGLGFTADHCGALVCLQYFANQWSAESTARINSARAVAAGAAKDAQASADAAKALGQKAAAEAASAQAAADAAAQAGSDAQQAHGPADASARAQAAARSAAQHYQAAKAAAGVP